MSEKLVLGVKYAFAGSVCALGVGVLVDTLQRQVTTVVRSTQISPDISIYLLAASGGTLAVAGILAGDSVLSAMISGEDPLFRMFYYQLAFHTMQAPLMPLTAMRNALAQGIATVSNSSFTPTCATGTCGQ